MNESEPKDVSRFHPGDVLNGNYGLMERLGTGNMGEVWKARHVRTKDEVALKLVRHGGTGLRPRLGQEYDAVSALRHPNIVAVISRDCTESGLPYLVMELLLGEDLRVLLARAREHEDLASRALSVGQSYKYIEQLARGLSHAHERHIVHRDLKPGNVFITREGQVKIADLGLAADVGAQLELTRTGTGWIGSEPYMAPEQRRSLGGDQRADIYSLSAIICEMLTGISFAEGMIDEELERDAVEARLTRGAVPIPDAIASAILRGLSRRPEMRQLSVEELFEPFREHAPEGEEARPLAPDENQDVSQEYRAPAVSTEREWEWPAATEAKVTASVAVSPEVPKHDDRDASGSLAALGRQRPWLWRGALALVLICVSVTLAAIW